MFLENIDTKQINLLELKYQEDLTHSMRQRAHVILMSNRRFGVQSIANALGMNNSYVLMLIKVWIYFGSEGLFSNNIDEYFEKVKEIETPKISEPKESLFSKFLNFLYDTFRVIFNFFKKYTFLFWIGIFAIFTWLFQKVGAIEFKKFLFTGISLSRNLVKIGKDSSNNVIFQIINNFPQGVDLSNQEFKTFIATSFQETREKFKELLTHKQGFLSEDRVIALIFALNERIQKIQDVERRKRYIAILATIAACYIYFHTSVKGGFLVFTIFSVAIAFFNVRSCTINLNKHRL